MPARGDRMQVVKREQKAKAAKAANANKVDTRPDPAKLTGEELIAYKNAKIDRHKKMTAKQIANRKAKLDRLAMEKDFEKTLKSLKGNGFVVPEHPKSKKRGAPKKTKSNSPTRSSSN